MNDKELVREVLDSGRTKSFAIVVKRYSGMLYSKSLGVVHSKELAAEVVQQTFIKAYANLDSWRGDQLGPWLSMIAMHTALNLLDKERRRRTLSIDDQPCATETTTEDYSPEHEQRLQQMESAIGRLPETDQMLIRLHYYEHKKTDEIANKMKLTQSNVLVKLHRIRERLRKEMNHGRNE